MYNNYINPLGKAEKWGCDFPPSLAQTKDARGIHASSSNASSSKSISCNLLVHSSSLSMERCFIDVPGSQNTVSMHGHVIGPKLMLEMQGTCYARCGSWAINPEGSSLLRLVAAQSTWSSSRTCEKYGFNRHPFTLIWCCLPEMSISW